MTASHVSCAPSQLVSGASVSDRSRVHACRYLSLGACGHVEDRHLCGLSLLSHLSHLGLAGCERLTDATLQALARCARLNRLELRGTAVTDTGLATLLPGLTALRLLGLERCVGLHQEPMPSPACPLTCMHSRVCTAYARDASVKILCTMGAGPASTGAAWSMAPPACATCCSATAACWGPSCSKGA